MSASVRNVSRDYPQRHERLRGSIQRHHDKSLTPRQALAAAPPPNCLTRLFSCHLTCYHLKCLVAFVFVTCYLTKKWASCKYLSIHSPRWQCFSFTFSTVLLGKTTPSLPMGFPYTSFGSSRKKSSALERLLPHHPVCPIASLEELSVVQIENVSVHPEYATYGMHTILAWEYSSSGFLFSGFVHPSKYSP